MAASLLSSFPVLRLNDGHMMPMVGYGLGSINMAVNAKHEDIVKRTITAIRAGYHHLDCAEAYGNEAALGEAIKECGVAREELFVTSKVLGSPGQDVQSSMDATLRKLGLEYVDMYLIHLPYKAPEEMPAMWAQLEALKASGKARSIGVSNFLQPHLEKILETANVVPAVNQIEYHPYLQHGNLVEFSRQQNIAVVGYSTLAAMTKARPGPVDEVYAGLAAKYGVTEADVAFRWCLDQGIAVVTTSASCERLLGHKSNLAKFTLSADEIQRISQLGQTKHYRDLYNNYFAPDDRA
ncbi:NADP-dependent oxidoreductase domain-containing protein [Staphylotrichum tortipilum]|uniref:NADP-dependent oxidoreductase domain-containing protein n=1 Tax=Staphylotrichum tortipilum TaxID=2831512 RepID=A0AAN6RUB7_9PEZI|nr:NADP-dependent oxidoreductase domain-containing protein [Staphylotrichum longicolle]